MYQRQSRGCGGCLLLIFDLIIITYFAAYIAGFVPHNPLTDFFIEGMKLGMR